MLQTRTGGYPIGFREVPVLSTDFPTEASFAAEAGFGQIDLTSGAVAKIPRVLDAGLAVGAIDLPNQKALLSPDRATRKEAVDRCSTFMSDCAVAIRARSPESPVIFLTIMLPEDPARPRSENYGYMLESYGALRDHLIDLDAWIVIEGWPGPGCVVSTPEGYRSFLRDCQCDRVGINYDPSHLMRMGVDPLRFLKEFCDRVYHVHAKDTEILTENIYEYGNEVPAIFAEPIPFGGRAWRYAIPGHGQMRWPEALGILERRGYEGRVSIELEDRNFNLGTGDAEREGLEIAARFLTGC